MLIYPNNIIVVFSEFDVTGKNPVLSKGEYKDYSWTLVRADKDREWKIEDQGYKNVKVSQKAYFLLILIMRLANEIMEIILYRDKDRVQAE